jgi:hypothetical protein
MSSVSVPAVRAALLAQHRAALDAAGMGDGTAAPVATTYGHPGEFVPPAFVAVSTTTEGVKREHRRYPMNRTSSQTEEYDLHVVVWVQTPDKTPEAQQAVTERAWAIAGVLDDGLRADYTIGQRVGWALFTDFDDEDFLLHEGRAAQLLCTVHVHVSRT